MNDPVNPVTPPRGSFGGRTFRIILLIVAAGFAVATCYVYAPSDRRFPTPAEEARQTLAEAKRALKGASTESSSFFTLEPHELRFSDKLTTGPLLQDWKILSEKTLNSTETAEALALLTAESTYTDMGAKCFDPGMGFRFRRGNSYLEFVICLNCRWVYAYVRGERFYWALSNKGKEHLLRIYKSHVSPDSKPER
jgi:hypothetical protein